MKEEFFFFGGGGGGGIEHLQYDPACMGVGISVTLVDVFIHVILLSTIILSVLRFFNHVY